MNKEMIAVDQDPLGIQGWHCFDRDGLQFWLKPLINDAWAFTILNPTDKDIDYALNWQDFCLTDSQVSHRSTQLDSLQYEVYNLWTHKKEGKTSIKNHTDRYLTIKSHDVIRVSGKILGAENRI